MDVTLFRQLKNSLGIQFSAAVAMTPNQVIGKDGGMPWHLPEDLSIFRKLTTGHPLLMGRKTFDSIKRPLPHRQNIVLTRDRNWQTEGVTVIHQPEEILELPLMDKNIFIIGGADIFSLYLPLIDNLFISQIHDEYAGDTYFPSFKEQFPHRTKEEAYPAFTLWKYTR